MRLAHKLCISGVTALVAIMLVAPSAFGLIEVKTEPNLSSQHCGAVVVSNHIVSGGCGIHAVSLETLHVISHNEVHSAEETLAICNIEFEARIDEFGEGYIYKQQIADALQKPPCLLQACRENIEEIEFPGIPLSHGVAEPWPVHVKDVGSSEVAEITLCIQQLDGIESEFEGLDCALHVPIAKISHVYVFDAEPEVGCENGETPDEREFKTRMVLEHSGEPAHADIEIANF